jgi:prepilin-type N-terminal cleavage/methylation domain-containing protein
MIIKKPSNQGFTLIEIIISLIVFGIMGSMLVTMGQTALTRSAELVGITRNAYNLEAVMENINSDYISMINPNNMNASILDDLISNLNTAGYYHSAYTYTVDSIVRFNGYVAGSGNTLVPGAVSANGGVMRVTISDASGMRLTALFFDNNI